MKVLVYLRCLSEGVFKMNWVTEHRRVTMMLVGMKEENPEGRGRGMKMEASGASHPPLLQVLLPNFAGSGLYFSLEAGLLCALYKH